MWYRRTASGNYSTLAEWETSIDDGANWIAAAALPSVGDIVFANGFTVTLDVDVTASELQNGAELNVSVGGVFNCGAVDYIIGDLTTYSSRILNNNSGHRVIITGDIRTVSSGQQCILGNSPVTIIGDVYGGSAFNQQGITSVTDVIVTGICKGGSGGTSGPTNHGHALYNCQNATVGTAMSVVSGSGYGVHGGSAVVDLVQRLDPLTDGIRGVFGSGIVVNAINNQVGSESLIYGDAVLSDSSTSVTLTVPTQTGSIQVDYLAGSAGYPSETNVKDGVIYGNSDQFEGTLQVVDTAQLASDLLDEMQVSPHVLAQRLRSAATDDSVGQIVASTLGF